MSDVGVHSLGKHVWVVRWSGHGWRMAGLGGSTYTDQYTIFVLLYGRVIPD